MPIPPSRLPRKKNQSALVYHAEIRIGHTRLILSDYDESIPHQRGNTVSLVITFETPEEVKEAFDLISDGAIILSPISSTTYSSRFIALIDKFSVRRELMTE